MAQNDERRRSGRVGSPVLNKIIVSCLLAAVTFLITQGLATDTANEVLLSLGASIFIGGVAFVTQFLIESDRRVDTLTSQVTRLTDAYTRHALITEQLIRNEFGKINEEFTKINAATELFGAVEASALKTDAMTQMVKHSTTVAVDSPPLIFEFAQAEIFRLSGYLRDLGQHADVTYEGEDRDWLLGLTRVATRTIDATSLTTVDAGGEGFVDGGLWIRDLGRRYLEEQQAAIARGVVVRRIFVLDRADLKDHPELVVTLNEQSAIGVHVRILEPRTVPPMLRAHLVDFIVIDGVLVYRSQVSARVEPTDVPTIESTRLITDPGRVRYRAAGFTELWSWAYDYLEGSAPAEAHEHVVHPVDQLDR